MALSGKVALVTGATGGIGGAITEKLAILGCQVFACSRKVAVLEKLADEVNEKLGKRCVVAMELDVTNRDQFKSVVATIAESAGPVDILVNNAGVMYFTMMKNLHEDEWERTIDVNCKGVVNGIGAVLSSMLERKTGHIVNISSDAGRKVFPGLSVYSASKFFIEAVSQGLRVETADSGIRVTCVQPGNVATGLLATSTDKEALEKFGTPTGAEILKPSDIAGAVEYAVTAPSYVAVNEVLIEPREEPV